MGEPETIQRNRRMHSVGNMHGVTCENLVGGIRKLNYNIIRQETNKKPDDPFFDRRALFDRSRCK